MNRLEFETAWGWMGMIASDNGVRAIILPKATQHAARIELDRALSGLAPIVRNAGHAGGLLDDAAAQLREYLAGTKREIQFPFDLSAGSRFQQRVWQALLRIPYGRVRSYRWVAIRVGGLGYARAVGQAVGANPVPILVPCHRVVSQDGSLGGFSGGLRTKRRLLALEGTLSQLR